MDDSKGTGGDRDTRLETLFDTSPDSIILHDANGAIVDVNDHAVEALGYDRDELLSMFVDEIDVSISLRELQTLWEQMDPGDRKTVIGEHRRKDGSTFPVEVGIRNLELDDRDRYLAISRDITERTKYEHRLSALHGSTRELVQASSKAEVADIAVEIAQDLLGFSLPVVWFPTEDGTALTMAARSPDMDALMEEAGEEASHPRGGWLWDAYESGETLVRDPIPSEQLGADVPLESAIVLPLDEHGVLTCATRDEGDFSDRDVEITEHLAQNVSVALDQIEFEQRLKHQRDNVRLLNHVMRHDIRNDLQVVTTTADLLEDDVAATHQHRIRTVRDRTSHAIELTETARDIAEIMETPDRDLREVPLRGVLEDEVAHVRDRYAEAEVTVAGSIPPVTVLADELLHSVFRNLLNNAVQHNPEPNPSVTVSAETEAGTAVVRVADDGPGVPEDERDEIFGKGEKGLESTGSGFGLHLVRRLIDEYGGRIAVRDNEPDGSVFVVELRAPGDQDG
jgi:PAS domain S-box-containing protein